MIFHLGQASAAGFPFLLELLLSGVEADLFRAKSFEVAAEFFALNCQQRGLLLDGKFLLAQCGFAAVEFGAFFGEACGDGFGGCEAFLARGHFGAARGEFVLLGLHGTAQLNERFSEADAFNFGFGAAHGSGFMLGDGAIGATAGFRNVGPEASEVVLANRQLETEAREFSLGVLVLVASADNFALGFMLLRGGGFVSGFGFAEFGGGAIHVGLHVGHARFEGNDFGVEGAEFALHAKGPGFVGAATGDHASLIGGAVGCHESVLRIFAGEFFRGGSAVSEIGTSQSGQKLFGGGAERIAEFDEFVETRVNAVFSAERNDRLVIGDLEIFGGVDEESGAAADFVAQEGDAGASVIKTFDYDAFAFIAETLFDCRFVVLGVFGVIGKHAD